MSFLLDTNVLIHVMNNHPAVRMRYRSARLQVTPLYVPTVVIFELHVGIEKSARVAANRLRLRELLASGITVLSLSEEDAVMAAQIRAKLEKTKQPIGPFDTLIAGQALARGLTLITANVREFARVDGLKWEDWALPVE